MVDESPSGALDLERSLFLMDGLALLPTPTLLVSVDPGSATAVAADLFHGSMPWPGRPSRVDGLLEVSASRLFEASRDDCRAILSEVAATDHWLLVREIDLLTQATGCAFLDELLPHVRDGRLASVILSTDPGSLDAVRMSSSRLAGFADVLVATGPKPWEYWTSARLVAAPAIEPEDAGWIVMVRFELATAFEVAPQPESATDGVMHLVEKFYLVGNDLGAPQPGVMITFTAGAFTASQEDAVFQTAETAATRLVGRPLADGECVTAVRALLYF